MIWVVVIILFVAVGFLVDDYIKISAVAQSNKRRIAEIDRELLELRLRMNKYE